MYAAESQHRRITNNDGIVAQPISPARQVDGPKGSLTPHMCRKALVVHLLGRPHKALGYAQIATNAPNKGLRQTGRHFGVIFPPSTPKLVAP